MCDPPAFPVAGIVLAAGAGRRFGMPKALVRYEGSLLVERAVGILAEGGCAPVITVLGAAAEEIQRTARLTGVRIVTNPDWATGMGSTLRTGLQALTSTEVPAAMILPVDMPGVTPTAVRRVAAHTSPEALAAASYGGQRGHPVLLGRTHWPGVTAASVGDTGARGYLRDRHVTLVACEDVSDNFDIDRQEDLRGR